MLSRLYTQARVPLGHYQAKEVKIIFLQVYDENPLLPLNPDRLYFFHVNNQGQGRSLHHKTWHAPQKICVPGSGERTVLLH